MKVCVVTAFTPTPENTRGISGLIYAILKHRPTDIKIKLYTYNFNGIDVNERSQISDDLQTDIIVVKKPWWSRLFQNIWMWRFCKYCMRNHIDCYMPNNRVTKLLRAEHADLVWIYPYFFYRFAKLMPEQRFVVSGCDCEALINVRKFETRRCLKDPKTFRHTCIMLKKGLHFENEWNLPNLKVHFVGEADKLFYERIYGYHNSFFILHPHYSLTDKIICFSKPKIKVIMTGGYDIYTEDDVNMMLPNLLKYNEELHEHFEFTLLGKNWEPIKRQFDNNKFICDYKTWVDDYAAELVQHDIQLVPISYGTGTKGKVLSALGNGLLVIGSIYAFENICVEHDYSCVCYKNASEVASLLLSVLQDKKKYQRVAENGRSQVLKYHDPQRVSKEFFKVFGS